MDRDLSGLVSANPDVLSGTPVFAGTRVPVKTLWDYLAAGESLDGFLAGFPSVKKEQALAVIAIGDRSNA